MNLAQETARIRLDFVIKAVQSNLWELAESGLEVKELEINKKEINTHIKNAVLVVQTDQWSSG